MAIKIALSAQLQSILNNVFVYLNLVVKEQALLTWTYKQDIGIRRNCLLEFRRCSMH